MKFSKILFVASALILGACQSVTPAAASKDSLVDVEGAFKSAPASMTSTVDAAPAAAPVKADANVASNQAVKAAPVQSKDCGLSVVETSVKAVGQPCTTTALFMTQLGFNKKQIARVESGARFASKTKAKKAGKKTAH